METVRLASMAMATRFELVVRGVQDATWLRAIGEEALAEIDRLDRQLSFYSRSSDVSRINRDAFREPVPVDARLFRLLGEARDLHRDTLGTFDVTVGPLMRRWGFAGGPGLFPTDEDLRQTMSCVGFQHVRLDEPTRTVQFEVEGVEVDLGGIGKGFAIDEAMLILEEAGVEHAFLHGGTSSMRALGDSSEASGWRVAISAPSGVDGRDDGDILSVVTLVNRSLAVSDIRGKWFETEAGAVGHVLDPRTGRPVAGASLAAVECASATRADALSTAFLVASANERDEIARRHPGVRILIASGGVDSVPDILKTDFDT